MRIYLAGCYSRMWILNAYLLGRREREVKDTFSHNRGGIKEYINEGISGRKRAMEIPRPDYRGGGIPNINENIFSTRSEQVGDIRLGGSVHSRGGVPNWKPYILESFYYADKDEIQKLMPYFGDFLLDSGAFTFMQNTKKHVDWNEYLEQYADFINTYKVDKFFELDIDSVIGYDNVLKLRKRLESLTGKQCIPVWHPSRGKEEFLKTCDEYPYVSIGGIAIKAIKSTQYKYFPWFIEQAHKRNTKVHGLGFTNLEGIKKYHFDSVDSTSWTTGNRFGAVYKFNGKTMVKYGKPEGTRIPKDKVKELTVNNFVEWCKFQQYADTHL